jgi:hypothetical protein
MIYEYGEPRRKDIDGRKQKNSERNLSQCNFAHHKFQKDRPGPPRSEAGDLLSEPWHGPRAKQQLMNEWDNACSNLFNDVVQVQSF